MSCNVDITRASASIKKKSFRKRKTIDASTSVLPPGVPVYQEVLEEKLCYPPLQQAEIPQHRKPVSKLQAHSTPSSSISTVPSNAVGALLSASRTTVPAASAVELQTPSSRSTTSGTAGMLARQLLQQEQALMKCKDSGVDHSAPMTAKYDMMHVQDRFVLRSQDPTQPAHASRFGCPSQSSLHVTVTAKHCNSPPAARSSSSAAFATCQSGCPSQVLGCKHDGMFAAAITSAQHACSDEVEQMLLRFLLKRRHCKSAASLQLSKLLRQSHGWPEGAATAKTVTSPSASVVPVVCKWQPAQQEIKPHPVTPMKVVTPAGTCHSETVHLGQSLQQQRAAWKQHQPVPQTVPQQRPVPQQLLQPMPQALQYARQCFQRQEAARGSRVGTTPSPPRPLLGRHGPSPVKRPPHADARQGVLARAIPSLSVSTSGCIPAAGSEQMQVTTTRVIDLDQNHAARTEQPLPMQHHLLPTQLTPACPGPALGLSQGAMHSCPKGCDLELCIPAMLPTDTSGPQVSLDTFATAPSTTPSGLHRLGSTAPSGPLATPSLQHEGIVDQRDMLPLSLMFRDGCEIPWGNGNLWDVFMNDASHSVFEPL